MFKFIRRKILEGLIKDFIKEIPQYKEAALKLLSEHKDEIIEKIKDAILAEIKKLIQEKK